MAAALEVLSFLLLGTLNTSTSPTANAPAPLVTGGYDVDAAPWNSAWSEQEKKHQRGLGLQLTQNITLALQSNKTG